MFCKLDICHPKNPPSFNVKRSIAYVVQQSMLRSASHPVQATLADDRVDIWDSLDIICIWILLAI